MNAEKILKQAFIDNFCISPEIKECGFSEKFEADMLKLIKNQQSVIKILNTTAKKVAAIIIVILTVSSSVLFSVSALREPIMEAIKDFFVNANQMLSGTAADDISPIFPTSVTKIIATSYVSETQNQYKINDENSIKSFVKLISQTNWEGAQKIKEFENTNAYWSYDFYDNDNVVLTIKMCDIKSFHRSLVAITKDKNTDYYYIDSKISDELLAFTNKKYYLHDSSLEKPSEEACEKAKQMAETGLKEGEILAAAKSVRNAHYHSEGFLIGAVRYLKESNSIYWDFCLSGEEFTDPVTNSKNSFKHHKIITDELSFLTLTVKDTRTKEKLKEAQELWDDGMKNHELEKLFKAHEILHDYDNYVFNYPTKAMYVPYGDYQGINDYFGHIS